MDTQHILSRNKITTYDFDPDSANAVDIAWVDMRDYDGIAIGFVRRVGTGDVDGFRILANSAADGSGSDVVIKTHALGSQPNALNDTVWLECSAEELGAAGTNLRYVSASVEFATDTDEAVIIYVRAIPRHVYANQTADAVA